jgi:hypothetical protein
MHSNETSPEMRQIRVLENRLDKVMIKYNEAPSLSDFPHNGRKLDDSWPESE